MMRRRQPPAEMILMPAGNVGSAGHAPRGSIPGPSISTRSGRRGVRTGPVHTSTGIGNNSTDLGTPTGMFLAKVPVSPDGAPTVYHDPSGHTTFTVAQESRVGPVFSVHAKRIARE